MLNSFFKTKIPFVYNYFSTLLDLKQREFPQGIVFEGADTKTQFLFSLELARILNCTGDKSPNCECTNCKWIKSFTHPAVNLVSQIHFKGEGDETKTTISVKQANEIEKTLALSSDYHRFFIFFSSKENEACENHDFKFLGYKSDFNFSIEPLNPQILTKSANALLKSVEEPPKRTTFIFLAKTKEDILSTIVSRCQVFKLSGTSQKLDYSDILNIINYPVLNYENAISQSEAFLNYIKMNSLDIKEVLNKFLVFLKDTMKQNIKNPQLMLKIKNDINIINTALKHSSASMQDKIILEAMFLRLARGY